MAKVEGNYIGPAYPFGAGVAGVFGVRPDPQVIDSSIRNILATPKGTLPYEPDIGSELPRIVFQPNDPITQNLISYFSAKDLADQEPRVSFSAAKLFQTDDPNQIGVTVLRWLAADFNNVPGQVNLGFNGEGRAS